MSAQRAAPTCACGGGGRETGHWSDWVGIRSCRQASSATTTTSTTAVRAQGSRTSYAAVIATSTTASSAAAAAAPIAAAGACTDTATVTTAWQSGACVRRSRRRGALHARGGACPPERRWRARAGTLAPQTHTHTHMYSHAAPALQHTNARVAAVACARACVAVGRPHTLQRRARSALPAIAIGAPGLGRCATTGAPSPRMRVCVHPVCLCTGRCVAACRGGGDVGCVRRSLGTGGRRPAAPVQTRAHAGTHAHTHARTTIQHTRAQHAQGLYIRVDVNRVAVRVKAVVLDVRAPVPRRALAAPVAPHLQRHGVLEAHGQAGVRRGELRRRDAHHHVVASHGLAARQPGSWQSAGSSAGQRPPRWPRRPVRQRGAQRRGHLDRPRQVARQPAQWPMALIAQCSRVHTVQHPRAPIRIKTINPHTHARAHDTTDSRGPCTCAHVPRWWCVRAGRIVAAAVMASRVVLLAHALVLCVCAPVVRQCRFATAVCVWRLCQVALLL